MGMRQSARFRSLGARAAFPRIIGSGSQPSTTTLSPIPESSAAIERSAVRKSEPEN